MLVGGLNIRTRAFGHFWGRDIFYFYALFLKDKNFRTEVLGVMVQTILSDPFFLYSLKRSIGLAILGEARKNVAELILSELYRSESMYSYVETGAGGGSNIPYSSYLNIPIDYKKYY